MDRPPTERLAFAPRYRGIEQSLGEGMAAMGSGDRLPSDSDPWTEAATAEGSALLHLQSGDPLLVERRVIMDQHGRPLERTESRHAADRHALDVGFSVEDRGSRARTRGEAT